jgi:GntR family transcriptional regulator
VQLSVHRGSRVPVTEQLRLQLELQILSGALAAGQKLPSVRALARRLGLHANTVGAAYRSLEATGRVRSRSGSGVYVEPAGADAAPPDARAALRRALESLERAGHSRAALREAARDWLESAQPTRVAVVDRTREMAELLAHELAAALPVAVEAHAVEALPSAEALMDRLLVTLPYHVGLLARLRPGLAVEAVRLAMPEACGRAVRALEADSLVLAVSHAEAVFPFAEAVVHGLRGEELTLVTCVRSDAARWRTVAPNAALVLADALSIAAVREVRPRGCLEFRLLDPASAAPVAAHLAPAVGGE